MSDSKPRDFMELVGTAIGRASVCWDEMPKGVFDSTTARKLCDEIIAAYDSLVKERDLERQKRNEAVEFASQLEKERDALNTEVEHLRSLERDHLDDMLRIQNAEREVDALKAQLAEARQMYADAWKAGGERIADLERKLQDATELISRMTAGAVRRQPEDSEIAGER